VLKEGTLITGALGSILKDRSADSVIRYNCFSTSSRILRMVVLCFAACHITIRTLSTANTFYLNGAHPAAMTKPIHYGGDSGTGQESAGRLEVMIFEVNRRTACIEIWNNIFANFSRTAGVAPIEMDFSGGNGSFVFGPNWVSPDWYMKSYGAAHYNQCRKRTTR
jgi:hypothetical protein